MRRVLTRLVIAAGIGLGGTLAVATGLALFGGLGERRAPEAGQGLRFGGPEPLAADVPLAQVMARDGVPLAYRRWDSMRADVPLVIAVHGSGWHGGQFRGLGAALAAEGLADVVAPDLRGHGISPKRRGDVAYIGQMEDDLADLVAATAGPDQPVILLGHSSGGGLVVRMAGGAHGGLLHGAILLAPFLQHDAPTTRPNAGGWAQVALPRIIGLTILNSFGIRALNHLEVIRFAFPDAVLAAPGGEAATTAYSFRLNTSYAPRRDWPRDVASLPPFLLVAGTADEAFVATAYQPAMSAANPHGGQYRLVQVGHLDVVDHPDTFAAIRDWLADLR